MSFSSLDRNSTPVELLKSEALINCADRVWGSFLCILALTTVVSSSVFTYFPDRGDLRDRVLFNSKIEPQDTALFRDFHVLFCMQGPSAILSGT